MKVNRKSQKISLVKNGGEIYQSPYIHRKKKKKAKTECHLVDSEFGFDIGDVFT